MNKLNSYEKAKHRYKIEAKNSDLKNVHGYDSAISYGIANMQTQGALSIFTVNLKINVEYVIYTSILQNKPV